MIFRQVRKVYMTLLETLIAVSLLGVMLVFVFGFFRELSVVNRMSEIEQQKSFQMRYVESRLNFIFERIVNENENDNKMRDFFFYLQPANDEFTKTRSLVFTFDNGVRKDPSFSGDVLGRLYVDLDHRLRLAIWSMGVKKPHEHLREEILLENVADVDYEFYASPEKVQNLKDIQTGEQIDPEKKMPKKDTWHPNEWAITYNQMPSILKIVVKVASDPKDLLSYHSGMDLKTTSLTYHFVLPSSKNPVHYPQEPG